MSADGVIDRIVAGLDRDGYSIAKDFLHQDLLESLRSEALQLRDEGEFRRAGVGRGETFRLDPEIRSDFVHWLELDEVTTSQQAVLDLYEELRLRINQTLYLGLFGWEGHLTVYQPGAFYMRHLDRFRNALHRTVSVILYLNSEWSEQDGGHLRIFTGERSDEFLDVLPRGGTLVTFMSDRFEHEVLPAARERVSLTGWFTRRT